jgi:hypothetical protein
VIVFPLLMSIVYFFGGSAKLNYDWLIEAMPLHLWIKGRSDIPIVGPLFAFKSTAYLMAWGGFLLDTFIAFFLLHKRLRWWALGAAILFHATNHLIFNIGIFPYLSLVMTSLYFEPNWPGKLVNWLAERIVFIRRWQSSWRARVANRFKLQSSNATSKSSADLSPNFAANKKQETDYQLGTDSSGSVIALGEESCYVEVPNQKQAFTSHSPFFGYYGIIYSPKPKLRLVVALALLIGVHVFLPLRHHYFDSNVAWSEEGHRYSWRMMLRSKRGYGGLRVVDRKTGEEEYIKPAEVLNKKQARKLFTHPDMVLQYAHHLGEACGDCAVYADIHVKLNNGKYGRYIDSQVDLTQIEWSRMETKPWILKEIQE